MPQSPLLLRRLLRAKDRMDGAPHEEWPIHRLAEVSAPPPCCATPNLPITDIALQTGWTSLGTFGRIFRDRRLALRCQ